MPFIWHYLGLVGRGRGASPPSPCAGSGECATGSGNGALSRSTRDALISVVRGGPAASTDALKPRVVTGSAVESESAQPAPAPCAAGELVLRPTTTDEVSRAVSICAQARVPLTVRGAAAAAATAAAATAEQRPAQAAQVAQDRVVLDLSSMAGVLEVCQVGD
jgi:FAD/FMN-containing dehydrogenase